MDAFIYDALRTPRGRGKSDGALHGIAPVRLAADCLRAIVERNALDASLVDDVVLGCVSPVGEQGAVIARTAVLMADLPETVPGLHVNRYCASGLEAVNVAAAKVAAGSAELVIAGGVESMSRVPMGADGGALMADPAVSFHAYYIPQGISADLIATRWNYGREELDRFAAESHHRAALAQRDGRFSRAILPVVDRLGAVALDRDETIRPETTAATLGSLRPSFAEAGARDGYDQVALQRYPDLLAIEHRHHAGNSSAIVDGAAAILIGTAAVGERAGLRPRARIRAMAQIGSEPTIMLTAPADAARKALARAGMAVGDIDLFEINEAFAAIVLRCMEDLSIDHDRVNVNGGAIALGHPLGATGAMLLGTAVDELERRGAATALITLCIGGGMGVATIIERV